jgi:tetratricopeptide (TPR) repeat protein
VRRRGSLVALAMLGLLLAPHGVQAADSDEEEADSSIDLARLRRLSGNVEDQLEAWDLVGARDQLLKLEQAIPEEPKAPAVLMMQAKVSFYSADYARAADLFAQAGVDEKEGSFRRLAEDALAETKDDAVERSEHFELLYPQGKDAVLAPYALDTLEKAYRALTEDFHFTPPGRIRVEVLNDDEALARLSTLTIEQIRTTGTIAICKFNRLMIISPKALLHGYDWRDTLNHEFVHYVVSMKSRNTVPIWLHEGLAKYEETRWRGEGGEAMTPAAEALLGQAVKHDKLVTFEQMHPSMALLPSQEQAATAFAEVFHAVEFLKKKGGTPLWNKIIDELKGGATYQEAVSHAYGASFTRFVADWKVYLGTLKYPAELISLESERLKFKDRVLHPKKKDAIEDTSLSDFADITDEPARQWAHLGGLLLVRKHPQAAIDEFEKAYARVGSRSVQLADLYAEALVGAARFDEAREVLRSALQLHPDDEPSHLHLGSVLLAGKDPQGAVAQLLAGVNTDPFDPRLHEELLRAYTGLKDQPHIDVEVAALRLLGGKGDDTEAKSEQGTVVLASHPFATVNIDGKDLGHTTPTVLQLPAGKHHLRLQNAEYHQSRELDVEVIAGQQQDLRLELSESPQN